MYSYTTINAIILLLIIVHKQKTVKRFRNNHRKIFQTFVNSLLFTEFFTNIRISLLFTPMTGLLSKTATCNTEYSASDHAC